MEDIVQRYPHSIAIKEADSGKSLTYGELNNASNELAMRLVQIGVEPDQIIPLYFEKSLEMMIGIFGVLKAGCCYCPLDAASSAERNQEIINSLKADIIVSNLSHNLKVIHNLNVSLEVVENYPNLHRDISPLHLAYTIFTSGSTGKPKCVMIEHHAAFLSIKNYMKVMDPSSTSYILQFSNYCVDMSVADIFTALGSGACLVLMLKSDLYRISDIINAHQITHLKTTPTVASLINFEKVSSLKTLILGGEKVPSELLSRSKFIDNVFISYGAFN